MKPALLLLALALAMLPRGAVAQEMRVDRQQVLQCFRATPLDAAPPACIGDAAAACQRLPGGETTLGTADCLTAETGVWDDLLNAEYRAAMARMRDQGGGALAEQLRDAQRAWIAFRDAECGLRYGIWAGGTIRVIIGANCVLRETAERALELRDLGRME